MNEKNLGNEFFATGKLQDAVTQYTKGIDRVVEAATTAEEGDKECLHLLYSNRSHCHLKLALMDEALQDAICAIEANPEYGKAYMRRSSVWIQMFRFEDALKDIAKAEELDPNLVESLKESRLIATEKKWVPNCFLEKQVELQQSQKYKATRANGNVYVLRLETPDGEVLEGAATCADQQSRLTFQKRFQAAYKTGDSFSMKHLSCSLCQPAFRNAELWKKVGNSGDYVSLVQEQMGREFGPGADIKVPAKPHPSAAEDKDGFPLPRPLPVGVYTATANADPSIKRAERRFYPGRPRWLELDLQLFADALKADGKGLLTVDVLRDAKVAIDKYRRDEQWLPTGSDGFHKCKKCKTSITDPDPGECMCGTVYCSDTCHEADYATHLPTCKRLGESLGTWDTGIGAGWFLITESYWKLVLKGYFPCKEEPDFAALWKAKEKRLIDNAATEKKKKLTAFELCQAESQFYVAFETPYLENIKMKVTPSFLDAMNRKWNHDPTKKDLFIREYMDAIILDKNRSFTPLPGDSLMRLKFKLKLTEFCYQDWEWLEGNDVFRKIAPPGATQSEYATDLQMPSRKELRAIYAPFIRQAEAKYGEADRREVSSLGFDTL